MKHIGLALCVLIFAGLLYPAAVFVRAHAQIRAIEPELPSRADLIAAIDVEDGPVGVSYLNTSSQPIDDASEMGHPAFVFEWADGRRFMLDAGMQRDEALEFGKPLELLLGAGPAVGHGSVVELMEGGASTVAGIAFTHLHVDHTGGIIPLCGALDRPLPVFQTPWQADERNYTTDMGYEHIVAAGCARPERLSGGAIHRIPGFPGLVAVAAGGHTPGSTMYMAQINGQGWLFSGDVTNSRVELVDNTPKERLYSLFIVPEAPERLEVLRLWLAALDRDEAIRVVVSHDLTALEGSGLSAWSERDRGHRER